MPLRFTPASLLFAALVASLPAAAQQRPVTVEPIFSGNRTAAGQPINLPQGDAQVGFSIFTIQPGARLPVHKHPYPRYGYMLDGELTVGDVEAGTEKTYRTGEVILEMVDRWHYGENRGAVPVRLLVIDQTPAGKPSTLLRQ